MNENIWFIVNQPLLLGIANTDYGRDLLCIPKEYGPIDYMAKNCVSFRLNSKARQSDFRVGAKWANVIRYRWEEFNSYARYFQGNEGTWEIPISPRTRYARSLVATTTTVYPDPNPETSTWDGIVQDNVSASWATIRGNATSGTAADSGNPVNHKIRASTTTDEWDRYNRSIYGFDTAAIDDGDVVSAAVLSFFGDGSSTVDDFTDDLVIDRTIPNSATSVTSSDYNAADWDEVSQANRINLSAWDTTDGNTNDFTLNSTGEGNINKTGVSWFGMRMGIDFDNSEPTWASAEDSQIGTYFAEETGTTKDPKLVVTHAAAAGVPSGLGLMGVGT